MRGDRKSAYEQAGLELSVALANEFAIGARNLDDAVAGAGRFSEGLGRAGSFEDL
jgi:enoyl-CoA hydratase